MGDVLLEGPKVKIAKSGPGMVLAFPDDLPKKLSTSGPGIFWAFPNDLPKKLSKSAQKVVQKWPQPDLGQKIAQKRV